MYVAHCPHSTRLRFFLDETFTGCPACQEPGEGEPPLAWTMTVGRYAQPCAPMAFMGGTAWQRLLAFRP